MKDFFPSLFCVFFIRFPLFFFTFLSIFSFYKSFPTKAFQIWLQTNDLEHVFIAGAFFHYSGLFEPPKCDDISPNPGRSDPLFIVRANKKK